MEQSISEILAVVVTLIFISADNLIDWFARNGLSGLYLPTYLPFVDIAGLVEFSVAIILVIVRTVTVKWSWISNGALGAVGYGCLVLLSKWLLV